MRFELDLKGKGMFVLSTDEGRIWITKRVERSGNSKQSHHMELSGQRQVEKGMERALHKRRMGKSRGF